MSEEKEGFEIVFIVFKQKTAYEMLRSLVGSEMCIRDRHNAALHFNLCKLAIGMCNYNIGIEHQLNACGIATVSYTHLTLPTIYSV